jgi:hypothetical protein
MTGEHRRVSGVTERAGLLLCDAVWRLIARRSPLRDKAGANTRRGVLAEFVLI